MRNVAGFLIRFIAVLGDWSLAFTLYSYLCSFENFITTQQAIKGMFNKVPYIASYLSQNPDIISSLIMIYIIYILLRFYTTIFFGVSIGQGMVGIKSHGPFWWKRIGGGIRVILEAVLGPVLIFDLPTVFKSRTLKELLTFTCLTTDGVFLQVFSTIFIIPCFILIAFFSPLLQHLTLIDGIKVSFTKSKKEKIDKETDFDSYRDYQSEHFHLGTFSSLKNGNFILIPSFKIVRSFQKVKVRPYLKVYDKENKISGALQISSRFSLLDILNLGTSPNPLFNLRYPKLSLTLKMDRDVFKEKKYDKAYEKNLLISKEVRDEIKDLVQSSFELGLRNLFDHLLRDGPFIKGHVAIRNSILSKISSVTPPEVTIIRLGNHDYLSMKQVKTDFNNVDILTQSLIPLGTANAHLITFEFLNNKTGLEFLKDFKESFFSVGDWYFDYNQLFPHPTSESKMNPLSVMDYFVGENIPQELRTLLENYIYHYLFDQCRESLQNEDAKLQKILSDTLDHYLMVAQLKNKKDPQYYGLPFINFLKATNASLQAADRGYFNL